MQLDKDDALRNVKRWLLDRLGIAMPAKWQTLNISSCAAAARVLCLRQTELKLLWSVEHLNKPLNPRNEAAALALLVSSQQDVCGNSTERQRQLHQLLDTYPEACTASPTPAAAAAAASNGYGEDTPEQKLYRWVIDNGAATQLLPALFVSSGDSSSSSSSNALRGCAAAADIPPGSVAVSVPSKILITYKTASESEFGQVLGRLGLDPETLAVVWTMVDRWDGDSPHKPFWDALPQTFDTGLSAPAPLVDLLKGCPEYIDFIQARQHVREQFAHLQQIFQLLLTAYAAHLQPDWFSEAKYLWAVELWYAYAIQVKFPDGSIHPALAPFVSLVNHSPQPHIVHYSTVDPNTQQLNLSTFRTVHRGQQAYLSYGPLPNSQLLLFYGFAAETNPFEEAVITIQQVQQQQQVQAEAAKDSNNVRSRLELLQRLGLPQQYSLTVQQPLPPGLMPSLRVLCATANELQAVQNAVQQQQQQDPAVQGDSSAGASKAKVKSKAGRNEASSNKGVARQGSRSYSSSSSADSAADLQAAWGAAVNWQAVLGTPISEANEATTLQAMHQTLAKLSEPYEACLAKIAKRRQLQQLLQQKQQASSSSTSQEAFLAGLERICTGKLALHNACVAAAAS